MGLDRRGAERQLCGQLGVAEPAGQQPQYLEFPHCQVGQAGVRDELAGLVRGEPFDQAPGDGRREQRVTRADHAYRRDELREFLTARKIGTEIYYPIPLHLQPCFVYLGYREGDFPEAERAAKEVLALPMFPELREDEQRWVVQSIADFYC